MAYSLESLTGLGFSERAAQAILREAVKKAGTQRTLDRKRRAIRDTPYQEWLKAASPDFVWDRPFHDLICSRIDDIIAGSLRRLMIFLPPRTGKSEAVTIRLPVYWLEANPKARVVVGAYNRDLATNFTSRSLRIYRSRNPDMIDSEAQEEWTTKAGGSVFAVGVGSGVTGRGADLMIIDDPQKNYEEAMSPAYQARVWNWWLNDMRTRLNDIAKTPVICIQTRWVDMDLSGRLLEQDAERKLWTVISFPAIATEEDILGRAPGESIWPERMPAEELEAIRIELGVRFDALYQQDPAPGKGGMIEEEWFWYDEIREGDEVRTRVRFWDLAASAVSRKNSRPDYTVGVRMALVMRGGREFYVVEDVARIRAETGERDTYMSGVMKEDGPDVLQAYEEVDDGDKSVTAYARKNNPESQISSVRPRKDKVVRSTNFRSSLQDGKVFLLRGRWNGEFVSELVRFPNGKHDDQVDAASGAHDQLALYALKVQVR